MDFDESGNTTPFGQGCRPARAGRGPFLRSLAALAPHRPAPWLAACLLLAGCGVVRLKPQLQQIEAYARLTGAVTGAGRQNALAVLLPAAPDGAAPLAYAVPAADGRFVIWAQPGSYRVFAFADSDADFVWDQDEPAALSAVLDGSRGGEVPLGALALGRGGGAARPVDLSVLGTAGATARSRRLGELVTLEDPRFAPEVVARGVWEPLRFISESGLAVYFDEPYDAARTPVLYVHGMQGSPRDFAALAASLDRRRFQAWYFYYPSGFSVDGNGRFLAEMLIELRRRFELERIDLVAHSMGGLVSRAALSELQRRAAPPLVDQFVTISTPWRGMEGARGMKIGLATAPVKAPSWVEMSQASEFLSRVFDTPLPAGVELSMLFGYAGNSALVSGADDETVALTSMLAWDAVQQSKYLLGFDATHESILRDERVAAVIQRILRHEPPTAGTAGRSPGEP